MSVSIKVDITRLPHGEGLAEPAAFVDELTAFSADEQHRIMRANCAELIGMAA